MFETIYSQGVTSIDKTHFDLLYEEYQKVLKKHEKLNHRIHTIMKQSDRQIHRQFYSIERHLKNQKRFRKILKQSDHQGRDLLDKTYNLEDLLAIEFEKERELMREIEETQKEVVYTMGAIGESRSQETGNHVKRVAEYSKLFALYYGLKEQEAEILKQASPMHDIGKVAIADSILNKPAKLTPDEFEKMKEHAYLGYQMLKHSSRPLMKAAAIVAREHHEKFDGTGYPRGLKGYEIHIYGRITAIADVFDALGSERVYKKAWSDEAIFTLLKAQRERQFDPKLVDIFFENLNEFLSIRDKFKDTI